MGDEAQESRSRSGSGNRQKQGVLSVRVSHEERAEIGAAAAKAGLSVGSFVRSRTLARPRTRPVRRPTPEARELARLRGDVARVGANIHQLLKRINFGDTPEGHEVRAAFAGCRETLAAIDGALRETP